MLKIITALENENINNKLKRIKDVQIIAKDIQYREGILEILESYKNIDYILLNKNIEGEITLDILIEKIKEINENIKIILIINKKEEKNKYVNTKNYYKVLYENELKTDNIYDILNIEKNKSIEKTNIPLERLENKEKILGENNNEIKEEIKKLRKIMIKNKLKNSKLKKDKIIKKIIEIKNSNKVKTKNFILKINKKVKNIKLNNNQNNILKNNSLKKCFVIYITGPNGVGKSSIITNLSKALSYLNKKILIIDFDFINNSIHTILGVKKIQTENYINKVNKNIDIISPKLINKHKNEEKEIINKINLLIIRYRKNYDYIFIDTNSHDSFLKEKIKKYYEIINNSDLVLFISGCNLLEINKTAIQLDSYLNILKTNNINFNILFNKYNNFSIDSNLLKNIFKEIKVLGFINNNDKYNSLINKNIKNFNKYRKIRKEYLEIIYLIEKNRRKKGYGN